MKQHRLVAVAAVIAAAAVPTAALADGTPDSSASPTPAAVAGAQGSATATKTASTAPTGTAAAAGAAAATGTATGSGTATGTGTATASSTTATPTTTPTPVVRTVSLTATDTFVALHRYSLHGSVKPLSPGPATVSVQRRVDGSWTRFKTDKADAQGRYAVHFSSNRPKRYTFRAVATWTNQKKATSGTLVRTVVARSEAHVSGPLTRRSVPYSYRAGCPVTPSGLRRITINRFTYSHVVARGSLVVKAGAVPDLLRVFRASFDSRFPVRSMKPTDRYYAGGRRTPTQSDVAAMKADNTSAFNCRPVTGNPYRVSQHSYGNAIDINTVRNPYVVGSRVYPSWARTYLDRRNVRTGMILRSGVIATRMRQNGWPWGARWSHPDYQHFSSNGG